MLKKHAGFTLIEVLIALMIIAIAMAAVIRSMNQSIRVTERVKIAMVTHWVAMDALSEIQLGMIPKPTEGSPVQGKTNVFGSTWRWSARVVDDELQNSMAKIIVQVYQKDQPVDSLIGYVS